MRPDDIFLSRLQLTITALRYWAPSIADAADIEENEAADHWRLKVRPHLAGACPFELILRTDQFYDISVADEDYEARPIQSLDLFAPLVEAIAGGSVLQRVWVSAATGASRAVETIAVMADGRRWHCDGDDAARFEGAVFTDHYFLPYRR